MQPIHFATMSNHLHIISTLVEQYGVDPNSKREVKMCSRIDGHNVILSYYLVHIHN